jgi:hypothetical protein
LFLLSESLFFGKKFPVTETRELVGKLLLQAFFAKSVILNKRFCENSLLFSLLAGKNLTETGSMLDGCTTTQSYVGGDFPKSPHCPPNWPGLLSPLGLQRDRLRRKKPFRSPCLWGTRIPFPGF